MYKIQQDAAASGWEKIRSSLLRAAVKPNAMRPEQCHVNESCVSCATLHCQKCDYCNVLSLFNPYFHLIFHTRYALGI